jgi:hypothetical protein
MMGVMERRNLERAVRLVNDANEDRRALEHGKASSAIAPNEWPSGGSYEQHLERSIARLEEALTDADLLRAYQATTGEEGDAEADVLCAEIERRQLDC